MKKRFSIGSIALSLSFVIRYFTDNDMFVMIFMLSMLVLAMIMGLWKKEL